MRPEQLTGKKILYGCLDWGNGHVARSIPLIQQLLEQGNKLTLWCSEKQRRIFEPIFGQQVSYHIGFEQDFHFKGDGNFFCELLRNAARFHRNIRSEMQLTAKFVAENQIDVIVSDHRYGLSSSTTASIFLTHQVRLPSKSGFIAQRIHRKRMESFDFIWVMDTSENRLAGELSVLPKNGTYIGHYSRFSNAHDKSAVPGNCVAIISGPEPYAEQLYRSLIDVAYAHKEIHWTFVCSQKYDLPEHDFPVIHDWKTANVAICEAEWIFSRNGYTTLMDLSVLGKKAVLIPTPGQLEQFYLAEYHRSHPLWKTVNGTDLKACISQLFNREFDTIGLGDKQ